MNVAAVVMLLNICVGLVRWTQRPISYRKLSRGGALLLRVIALAALIGLWVAVTDGDSTAVRLLPALVVVGALIVPGALVRWVTVPLGLPRATYYLARVGHTLPRLALLRVPKDAVGPASLMAARALGRRREPTVADADWVARRHHGVTLRGTGMVAHGLVAAAMGDADGARALLAGVALMDRRCCPRLARGVAAEWLAGDAAVRGDWPTVRAQRGTRTTWLLEGLAARILGEAGAPGDLELRLRWLLAPHRFALAALVRRALAAPEGAPTRDVPDVVAVAPAEGDALAHALARHASLMQLEDVRADEMARLAGAWDECLAETDADLRARAQALGTSDAQALAALRADVHADLAALARLGETELAGAEGEVLAAVRSDLQHALLSELELASGALRRRIEDQRQLASVDEWREFVALRLAYQRGARICGRSLQRLAYPTLNADICLLAVWLFNKRQEKPMANAMFRWLLGEAREVEDERAIALHTKNVACGTD